MGFGGAAEQTKAYNAWTNAIRERDYGGSIQGLHAMQKALKTPEAALKDGKFLDALRKT